MRQFIYRRWDQNHYTEFADGTGERITFQQKDRVLRNSIPIILLEGIPPKEKRKFEECKKRGKRYIYKGK